MKARNKPRILFLLHLPPPIHGSSIVGRTIQENISINTEFSCNYINLLASRNVAESGKINSSKLFNFMITWIKVFVSITRYRPNLCYLALTTTGAAFFKDLLFVALLKAFRINLVYHLHNKGVSLYGNKKRYRVCYNFLFKNAEVILLSKRLYSDIQAFVPYSKIHICPNGIADEALKSIHNTTKQLSLKHESDQHLINKVKILFISNLFESKGVYVLLDACKILKKRNLHFHCTFVGGEGDISKQQFQDKTKHLNLLGYVEYLGTKFNQEKANEYTKAHIFAFPTFYHNECFPLVILEAMQYKLPIVTTLEGGIPDMVEDGVTGFLVNQKDVENLANNLELLIQNSRLRKRMGVAGRKKYEEDYKLEIFELRLINIFRQIIRD